MNSPRVLLVGSLILSAGCLVGQSCPSEPVPATLSEDPDEQVFSVRHISEWGAFPDDGISDHDAFIEAYEYFQNRLGQGKLLLDAGTYIVGLQTTNIQNCPYPPDGWYCAGQNDCPGIIMYQPPFELSHCANFGVFGSEDGQTTIRFQDCLLYGRFAYVAGEPITELYRGIVGTPNLNTGCIIGDPSMEYRAAAIGSLFKFTFCHDIILKDLELDGNITGAIIGGNTTSDGIQGAHDGVWLYQSARVSLENLFVHDFGRDGLYIGREENNGLGYTIDDFDGWGLDEDVWDGLIENPTLIFNNQIIGCKFNWNLRTGIAWQALAGLKVFDTEVNFNGIGSFDVSPGYGLNMEPFGGILRPRYGVFCNTEFLHNRGFGVHTKEPCFGARDFRFYNCILKPGNGNNMHVLQTTSRKVYFNDCDIYGRVANLYSEPYQYPYQIGNPNYDFDIEFQDTRFHEQDDTWSYTPDLPASKFCSDNVHMFNMTVLQNARAQFRGCEFHLYCDQVLRMFGRGTIGPFETCVDGEYLPCQGCPSDYSNYVVMEDCIVYNHGIKYCVPDPVIDVNLTAVQVIGGLTIIRPDVVRDQPTPLPGQPWKVYDHEFDTYPDYSPVDENGDPFLESQVSLALYPVSQVADCLPHYLLNPQPDKLVMQGLQNGEDELIDFGELGCTFPWTLDPQDPQDPAKRLMGNDALVLQYQDANTLRLLSNGKPLAALPVNVYGVDGRTVYQGMVGQDGVLSLVGIGTGIYLVVVEHAGRRYTERLIME